MLNPNKLILVQHEMFDFILTLLNLFLVLKGKKKLGRTMASTKTPASGNKESQVWVPERLRCGHRLPKKCLNFEPNQGV